MELDMTARACEEYVDFLLAGYNYYQSQINLKLVLEVKSQIKKFVKSKLIESDVTETEINLQAKFIAVKLKRGMLTYDIAMLFAEIFNTWFSSIFTVKDFIYEAKAIKRTLNSIKVKLTPKKYYMVEFYEGGKPYAYDYAGHDIEIGDKVVVLDTDKNEVVVTVVEYAPLCLNTLEFDLKNIKSIIRKVDET